MVLKLSNNAESILIAPITDSDTTLTIQAADADKFPALGAADWHPVTVVDPTVGTLEIMRVTARDGAMLTVVRAQEGTTAKAFAAGALVELRPTVGAIEAFAARNSFNKSDTFAARSDYDNTAPGFAFFATDTQLLYIKQSETIGDWSPGIPIIGPAGVSGASRCVRVRAVATNNVDINTELEAGDTIDGVVLAQNDLVLVPFQNTPADNGIRVVGLSGQAVRHTEFDTYDKHPGVLVIVEAGGPRYGNSVWRCTSPRGGTLGTTELRFHQLSVDRPVDDAFFRVQAQRRNWPIYPVISYAAIPEQPPPARLQFSRASTATRVNSKGFIEDVQPNVVRHQYDPVTGQYWGWLLENLRLNVLLHSADFTQAAWTKSELTFGGSPILAPDGTTTSVKATPSTNNQSHYFEQEANFSSTGSSLSIFAKAAGYSRVGVELYDPANPSTNFARAVFNLEAGVAESTAVGGTFNNVFTSIVRYTASDHYRIGLGVTGPGATIRARFYVFDATAGFATAYAGDGSSGVYFWGAQGERSGAGRTITSYIKTTTGIVTRNSDTLSRTLDGLHNAAEGAIVVEGVLPGVPTNQAAGLAGLTGVTTDDRISLRSQASAADGANLEITTGAVQQANISQGDLPERAVFTAACSWANNDFKVSLNGGSPSTDTAGTVPPVQNLVFGPGSIVGAVRSVCIRHFALFARNVDAAGLQTLSTG